MILLVNTKPIPFANAEVSAIHIALAVVNIALTRVQATNVNWLYYTVWYSKLLQ